MAIIANGQNFTKVSNFSKVIKDTNDYILKEVDSVYYYTYGNEPKNDFALDTIKIHKENGVLKLPLINGKLITFIDSLKPIDDLHMCWYDYNGENGKLNYYLVSGHFYEWDFTYLINKRNGKIDTLETTPIFSPSDLFYGYAYSNELTWNNNVTFKNLKTNKTNKIILENELPQEFKWIDDYHFLFYTILYDKKTESFSVLKYYLVGIKK